MKDVELKLCPFCGGAATIHTAKNVSWALCVECNAGTAVYNTEEEVADAWNKRVKLTEKGDLKDER